MVTSMPNGCGDEIPEKRVRRSGGGFKLRVKLPGKKPGMVLKFDDLDEVAVG